MGDRAWVSYSSYVAIECQWIGGLAYFGWWSCLPLSSFSWRQNSTAVPSTSNLSRCRLRLNCDRWLVDWPSSWQLSCVTNQSRLETNSNISATTTQLWRTNTSIFCVACLDFQFSFSQLDSYRLLVDATILLHSFLRWNSTYISEYNFAILYIFLFKSSSTVECRDY